MKNKNKTNALTHSIKYIFIGINIHDKKVTELESLVEHVYHIKEQTFQTEVDKNIKQICKNFSQMMMLTTYIFVKKQLYHLYITKTLYCILTKISVIINISSITL